MEREELLKKVREGEENREWEQSVADKGISLGYAVTILLALIFAGIEYYRNDPHWEILGIPMFGIGIGDIYEGIKTGNSKKLRSGIINGIIGLMFLAAAIIRW